MKSTYQNLHSVLFPTISFHSSIPSLGLLDLGQQDSTDTKPIAFMVSVVVFSTTLAVEVLGNPLLLYRRYHGNACMFRRWNGDIMVS